MDNMLYCSTKVANLSKSFTYKSFRVLIFFSDYIIREAAKKKNISLNGRANKRGGGGGKWHGH